MKKQSVLLIVLLLTGLLLSSILRFRFTIDSGFIFEGLWLKIMPLPIFDYAGTSNEPYLSSTLLGYLFFIVFGLMLYIEMKNEGVKTTKILILMLLIVFAFSFEFYSIVLSFNSVYSGRYLRIGPTLFLLGLFIYNNRYQLHKKVKLAVVKLFK